MGLSEKLDYQIHELPEPLQKEVLDFVQFLKQKSALAGLKEEEEWSGFSLSSAMADLDEKEPAYDERNLKEQWQ